MYITDNPDRDFDRWDREQANALVLLPRCCECDEAIQDDYCYEINGKTICEQCMRENHRKATEHFIM